MILHLLRQSADSVIDLSQIVLGCGIECRDTLATAVDDLARLLGAGDSRIPLHLPILRRARLREREEIRCV